ncbi:MAG: aminotransferase class III-fold pyridoxal phosphate-dependent enzyme, partial [Archangium sp.]
LAEGLAELAKLPNVREVRRRGFMIGVEVQRAGGAAYEFGERMGFRVCTAARKDGVLLRPLGNVVVLMPPLSLSVDEAKLLLRATRGAIERTCRA